MIGTVILRKNILPPGWLNSAWIELTSGKKIKNIENFLQSCGFPMLMEKLFREQTVHDLSHLDLLTFLERYKGY